MTEAGEMLGVTEGPLSGGGSRGGCRIDGSPVLSPTGPGDAVRRWCLRAPEYSIEHKSLDQHYQRGKKEDGAKTALMSEV